MMRVDEDQLYRALKKYLDLLEWVQRENISPWTNRQALITALVMNANAALERGIPRKNLVAFDRVARLEALKVIARIERRQP